MTGAAFERLNTMRVAQNLRAMICIAPLLLDNATAVNTVIDRVVKGSVADHVSLYVSVGVTDIGITTLKVQESDDNATWTDIPETVFGANGNPALPGATDDGKLYSFLISGLGRKRYFRLQVTAADGTQGVLVSALAILSEPHTAYSTPELRGATGAEVIVI